MKIEECAQSTCRTKPHGERRLYEARAVFARRKESITEASAAHRVLVMEAIPFEREK